MEDYYYMAFDVIVLQYNMCIVLTSSMTIYSRKLVLAATRETQQLLL